MDIKVGQYLVVSNFNEGWLVVSRGLKSMEVHHSGSNVGEPRGLNVIPEFHSRVQTRASNCNRDLQVLTEALKIRSINMSLMRAGRLQTA